MTKTDATGVVLLASNAVCIIELVVCSEEAGVRPGFFVPAIWILDESPDVSDSYWCNAWSWIIHVILRRPIRPKGTMDKDHRVSPRPW